MEPTVAAMECARTDGVSKGGLRTGVGAARLESGGDKEGTGTCEEADETAESKGEGEGEGRDPINSDTVF